MKDLLSPPSWIRVEGTWHLCTLIDDYCRSMVFCTGEFRTNDAMIVSHDNVFEAIARCVGDRTPVVCPRCLKSVMTDDAGAMFVVSGRSS